MEGKPIKFDVVDVDDDNVDHTEDLPHSRFKETKGHCIV